MFLIHDDQPGWLDRSGASLRLRRGILIAEAPAGDPGRSRSRCGEPLPFGRPGSGSRLMTSTPGRLRAVLLDDPVDLLGLACASNPFIAADTIVDRQLVTEQIGLLIGGGADRITCLYLSIRPLADLSPWMAHAAWWLGLYPAWRRLHGWPASDVPPDVVLAGPDFGDDVKRGLSLLALPVRLVRYACVECEHVSSVTVDRCFPRDLCWEADDGDGVTDPGIRRDRSATAGIPQRFEAPHRREPQTDLSAEETEFFRRC